MTVMGCPSYTFAILDRDAKPTPPVFVKIKPKCNLSAMDSGGSGVSIPKGAELEVVSVFPNNIDFQQNFLFTVKWKGRQMRMSGVSRQMFAVTEGDGESLWDDDALPQH